MNRFYCCEQRKNILWILFKYLKQGRLIYVPILYLVNFHDIF